MKPCSMAEPTTSMLRALYCLTIEAACLSEIFAPIYWTRLRYVNQNTVIIRLGVIY
jgi:hypothetical protein